MKIGYLLNFWSYITKKTSIFDEIYFWVQKKGFFVLSAYIKGKLSRVVGWFESCVRVGICADHLLPAKIP